MIDILPDHKAACCGCRACEQACPAACISMVEDEEGFLYPQVNEALCTSCDRCEDVCPVCHAGQGSCSSAAKLPLTIGGYHRDASVRHDSSSGGAFTLLAEHTLERGGAVVGCALDDSQRAAHLIVTHAEDLPQLRGSKYVQSDMRDSYSAVQRLLEDGTPVLFVGTPCQAAGLHSFLGKRFENLLTCDFICHGVPSPKVFADYLASLERRGHGRVSSFRFRTKDRPWRSSGLQTGTSIVFEDGFELRHAPAFTDPFMNGFLADLTLRPICHDCPFKRLPKDYADLTIADFWGVKTACPELDDGGGTSLLLLHSNVAKTVFEQVNGQFVHREVSFADAIRRNPTLLGSSPANALRERFFRAYEKRGFARIAPFFLNPLVWALHRMAKTIHR